MPLISKPLDKYLCNYIGGTTLQNGEAGAIIECFSGITRVGSITFFADNRILSKNQAFADGTLALYYQMSRFNDVMSTLRFEKPLMLAVNTDTGFGYLGSSQLEGVGEQEGLAQLAAAAK